jgi:predicted 3-demethylubiquinone-9 3-methyltransferase (glyoxalase superfamily)
VQKITPFLWFNDNAEEAMDFYVSTFKNSRVISVSRYGDAGPGAKGSVMVGEFEIEGQSFVALNGGPMFKLTEAVSFVVRCESQAEVDEFWDKLSEGGEKSQCGWLKDRFGLSWQVVPTAFLDMMRKGEEDQCNRMMEAMMKMGKLDIAGLERAFHGA